jgi:hypothetical protein
MVLTHLVFPSMKFMRLQLLIHQSSAAHAQLGDTESVQVAASCRKIGSICPIFKVPERERVSRHIRM